MEKTDEAALPSVCRVVVPSELHHEPPADLKDSITVRDQKQSVELKVNSSRKGVERKRQFQSKKKTNTEHPSVTSGRAPFILLAAFSDQKVKKVDTPGISSPVTDRDQNPVMWNEALHLFCIYICCPFGGRHIFTPISLFWNFVYKLLQRGIVRKTS